MQSNISKLSESLGRKSTPAPWFPWWGALCIGSTFGVETPTLPGTPVSPTPAPARKTSLPSWRSVAPGSPGRPRPAGQGTHREGAEGPWKSCWWFQQWALQSPARSLQSRKTWQLGNGRLEPGSSSERTHEGGRASAQRSWEEATTAQRGPGTPPSPVASWLLFTILVPRKLRGMRLFFSTQSSRVKLRKNVMFTVP